MEKTAELGLAAAIIGALLMFTNDVKALDYIGGAMLVLGAVTEAVLTVIIVVRRLFSQA